MIFDLNSFEKRHNINLPKVYKELYESDFYKISTTVNIHIQNDIFNIRRFLLPSEIDDIMDEFYDFLGHDIVPFAEIDAEEYICLYYQEIEKNPSIIYWNYELALENAVNGILFLYENIEQFLKNIRQ